MDQFVSKIFLGIRGSEVESGEDFYYKIELHFKPRYFSCELDLILFLGWIAVNQLAAIIKKRPASNEYSKNSAGL